ncbi:MAG: 1-phosphofructokinase family hexose kinase, partial [Bacillota bacterium]
MQRYALTVTLNAAVDVTYLLDSFTIGEIHAVAGMSRAAGGKANNAARVLRTMGVAVTATGFAGGHAGAFVQTDLRRLQITADYEEIEGETRTCLTMVDRTGGSLTEVRERGPVVPPEGAARFLARFRRLLSGAGAVVISGSLPQGLPDDYYAQLVREARRHGVYTLLDSSGNAL